MAELITSRHNVRVKEAAKLRSARQRAKQGRTLIDGAREISRALDAGVEMVEAFVCRELCGGETASDVACRLADELCTDVTPEVFEKLCFGDRSDGVVVVANAPRRTLDQIELPPKPLVAVLVGLEKPGNVGAILRTADGAGVDAVIVADGGTDLFNPNTIRASLGTVFSAQVAVATVAETVDRLRAWRLPIVVARPDAAACYTDVDFSAGTAIVLGNEASGISSVWPTEDVVAVRLPMQGVADSLNVSAAAAIMFYEAVRQRANG